MKYEVVSVRAYKHCYFVSVIVKNGANIVAARDNICCVGWCPRIGQEIRVYYSKQRQRRYGFEA